MKELAEGEKFALFGGGVDQTVAYVRDGRVFEPDYKAKYVVRWVFR